FKFNFKRFVNPNPSSDEEHEEENIPGPAVDRVDKRCWPMAKQD
ncbi:hypothetical protein Hamer_G026826, partial [Homarus americanus]